MMSLYMLVGMVISRQGDMDLHDFVDRTSHLLILSLILIWFGANQWRSGLITRAAAPTAEPVMDESPQETGLRGAMTSLQSAKGVLVWREVGKTDDGHPLYIRSLTLDGGGEITWQKMVNPNDWEGLANERLES